MAKNITNQKTDHAQAQRDVCCIICRKVVFLSKDGAFAPISTIHCLCRLNNSKHRWLRDFSQCSCKASYKLSLHYIGINIYILVYINMYIHTLHTHAHKCSLLHALTNIHFALGWIPPPRSSIRTDIHTYMHTFHASHICIYIQSYIRTYIHTYKYTYIHMYIT